MGKSLRQRSSPRERRARDEQSVVVLEQRHGDVDELLGRLPRTEDDLGMSAAQRSMGVERRVPEVALRQGRELRHGLRNVDASVADGVQEQFERLGIQGGDRRAEIMTSEPLPRDCASPPAQLEPASSARSATIPAFQRCQPSPAIIAALSVQ